MNFQTPSILSPPSLKEHLLIAVDLGFSSKNRSCGLAWQNSSSVPGKSELTFGLCVREVAKLMVGQEKVALIIEAPLSGVLGSVGNPIGRDPFEIQSTNPDITGPRYWYTGAGATICLAAIFFLRAIGQEIEKASEGHSPEISLFEGFVTFKSKKTRHDVDAVYLLECLSGKRSFSPFTVQAGDGETMVSIVDLLSPQLESIPTPLVIQPRI